MQIGRYELFTDAIEITEDNIIPILMDVFPMHQANASKMQSLLEYEAGNQPLIRKKKYRPDINCKIVDNVAHEITKFHVGYKWGIPITIVQRGEKDSGFKNEVEAITLLNEQYEMQEIKKKTQRLARFVEICGVGYTFADINSDDKEKYFNIEALDPRTTFVVRSNYYYDHRIMIAATYRTDKNGNNYFTCFTKDYRFEITNLVKITNGRKKNGQEEWYHADRSGEINPLGIPPIVEWVRNDDRMGCFERQMTDMDNLNLLVSDYTNSVDQNVQTIWHGNDMEFPKKQISLEDGSTREEDVKPETNDWVITQTTPDGKTPFIKPLAVTYDYTGMLNNIITRRALILQNADVPSRGGSSGGNTGSALDISSGWETTEAIAAAQQNIMESCKMEEIKIVLRAIQNSSFVPADSPLLQLQYKDCQANIKRNKSYELATKTNAWATLVSHGMNGYHAFKTVNLVDDINQVWADSKEGVEQYQMSVYGNTTGDTIINKAVGGNGEEKPNAERTMQDQSDQISNSPNMDGKRTE